LDGISEMNNSKILFRVHAVQRMFERGISAKKVRSALEAGETIEDYSSEIPEPNFLTLSTAPDKLAPSYS